MAGPGVITNRVGAALIGGGFIGPVHAEALRRIGVDLIGLLGSSVDRARPMAESLRIDRVYATIDELLDDPAVSVVHVASPNAAHFEQTRRILESGRHVVCEKPLAIDASQTRRLVDLARARPSQAAAVNYNVRYYALCQEMRDRVSRGDLGRILTVNGSYTQDWLLEPTDYNWRVEADGETNLRAVADIGTHWMDLAQFVVGRPIRSVVADLATFHPVRQRPVGGSETFAGSVERGETEPVAITTEDHGAVLFRMDDGIRGLFHASQVVAGRKNRLSLEVAGTEGSMAWDSETPDQLWIGRRHKANEIVLRDPSLLSPAARAQTDYPGGHAEGFPDSFKHLALDVYRWIDAGAARPPRFPTFADGHREILLCAAIARSARESRWIEVVDESSSGLTTP